MSLPTLGYLAVLLEHAGYAAWLIRTRRLDLAIGSFRTPGTILAGLLLLNGFSLACFFWSNPILLGGSVFLHALLLLDEILRVGKGAKLRWPFAVNHVLFIAALMSLFR